MCKSLKSNEVDVDLSCSSASFALQHGGFVPREWLAVQITNRIFCFLLYKLKPVK